MLTLSGINTPPMSVVVTLDAAGQTSLVSVWPRAVELTGDYRAWSWVDGDGASPIGSWWPGRRTLDQNKYDTTPPSGLDTYTQTIRWSRYPTWEVLAAQLQSQQWLEGQLSALAGSGTWLYTLDRLLAQLDEEPLAVGAALAAVLASDLPRDGTLDDFTRTLGEYQLAVDPSSLFPSGLIDLSGGGSTALKPLELTFSEWSEELGYAPTETRRITCRYALGAQVGSVSDGTDATLPALQVEDAAASRIEAYVEIALQRLRLMAGHQRASAMLPLDLSLSPGQTVDYRGQTWVILRAVHRMSQDDGRADRTELALRPVLAVPGSLASLAASAGEPF